jgi:hypothetical protein
MTGGDHGVLFMPASARASRFTSRPCDHWPGATLAVTCCFLILRTTVFPQCISIDLYSILLPSRMLPFCVQLLPLAANAAELRKTQIAATGLRFVRRLCYRQTQTGICLCIPVPPFLDHVGECVDVLQHRRQLPLLRSFASTSQACLLMRTLRCFR